MVRNQATNRIKKNQLLSGKENWLLLIFYIFVEKGEGGRRGSCANA